MVKKKLPWFKCNPEKLLNGLAGLSMEEGYLYVVALLRIYESGGPVGETSRTLALRCHMKPAIAEAALATLLALGKLITSDGLISNPVAETALAERGEIHKSRSGAASEAANSRWKNHKQNQQNGDASAMRRDADIEVRGKKEDQQTQNPTTTNVGSLARNRRPRSSDDYTSEFEGVWASYPRTRGTSKKNAFKQWNRLSDAQRSTVIRVMPTWRTLMARRDEDKIKHLEFYLSANVFETLEQATIVARDESTVTDPKHFSAERWATLLKVYSFTNDWKQAWGPPPGYPGCLLPAKLLPPISKARLDTHASPA